MRLKRRSTGSINRCNKVQARPFYNLQLPKMNNLGLSSLTNDDWNHTACFTTPPPFFFPRGPTGIRHIHSASQYAEKADKPFVQSTPVTIGLYLNKALPRYIPLTMGRLRRSARNFFFDAFSCMARWTRKIPHTQIFIGTRQRCEVNL